MYNSLSLTCLDPEGFLKPIFNISLIISEAVGFPMPVGRPSHVISRLTCSLRLNRLFPECRRGAKVL